MRRLVGFFVVATGFTCAAHAGTVLHVDDDAAAGGDGAAWASAYRFLSDALFAAQPGSGVSEIRVGQGLYTPDRDEANPGGTGDRAATFALIDDVAVTGGYAGLGAPDPDERDVEQYETVLSGDLLGDDESGGNDGENSHHVVTGGGTTITAVLDGVTITRGNTDGSSAGGGGGVFIFDGSPLVRDCTISWNSAPTVTGSGAGVMIQNGDARFERCHFANNAATTSSTNSAGGGAVYCFGGGVTLVQCAFTANSATRGGAIYVAGDVMVDDCEFEGNAATYGGAIHRRELSALSNRLSVVRSRFEENFATFRGGAIDLETGDETPTLMNCEFLANRAIGTANGGAVRSGPSGLTMGNCVLAGNTAGGIGGGLVTNGGSVRIVNCTIASNFAGSRGGGVCVAAAGEAPVVLNSVAWNNESGSAGKSEAGQLDRANPAYPLPAVSYSLVQGLTGALGGVGNLGDDPAFADPDGVDDDPDTYDDNDYRLAPGSPAIDAGHNWGALPDTLDLDGDGNTTECTPEDVDGAARFADDPAAPDTGCGAAVVVEMGAFESGGESAGDVIPGDLTGDGLVNFPDLLGVLSSWGPAEGCVVADFDLNGIIDFVDLLTVLGNWS